MSSAHLDINTFTVHSMRLAVTSKLICSHFLFYLFVYYFYLFFLSRKKLATLLVSFFLMFSESVFLIH